MKRGAVKERRYSEETGKLHLPCPFKDRTGINIHVVIRGRYCYRSDECMVLECKYNKSSTKIENILSMTW